MPSFEEIGRKIDKELKDLRQYIDKELKPTTRRKTVEALQRAAKHLASAARELEARAEKLRK